MAIIVVIQHHITGADPGQVAFSYALGITSKLSGLVSSLTEIERELVAVERCGLYVYIDQRTAEQQQGNITPPYHYKRPSNSKGICTM